jgi:hypothetical protein
MAFSRLGPKRVQAFAASVWLFLLQFRTNLTRNQFFIDDVVNNVSISWFRHDIIEAE